MNMFEQVPHDHYQISLAGGPLSVTSFACGNYTKYVRLDTKQQKLFCSRSRGQRCTKREATSMSDRDDKQEGMCLLIEKSRLIEGQMY